MEKEKTVILEKLREVKSKAIEDLKGQSGYENSVIQNVKYFGKVKLISKDGQVEFDLFTIEEYDYQMDDLKTRIYLDGQEIDIGELIRDYDSIEPIKDMINKSKELEENKQENGNKIYDLNKLETEKQVEGYSKALDKDKEDIKDVNEISLKDDEEKDINRDGVSKLNKREETNLNQVIKGETLRKILGLSGEYVKIAIVSSSQVNKFTNPKNRHNNKDSFIAIKSNGECVVLGEDIITQDRQEGTNTTDRDLTINSDGSVDYEQNTSSYKIVNRPNFYLTVGYDENVGKEIKIAERSRTAGTNDIEYELETQRTWPVDYDARKLRMEKNGINKTDKIKERQEDYEKIENKNKRVENIDNNREDNIEESYDLENKIIEGTNKTWRQFANECGYRGEGAIDRVVRKLIDYKKDNQDLSNQELVDLVIEQETENFRSPDLEHKR